jgi:hypothetical protein
MYIQQTRETVGNMCIEMSHMKWSARVVICYSSALTFDHSIIKF